MKFINEIGFLISWPRELDMFSSLIVSSQNTIIVDDLIYDDSERFNNSLNIIKLLDNKKQNYVLLSDTLSKVRYCVILSTAQSFQERITLKSYVRYIYANTIGRIIDLIGLSNIFLKILSRPLTGDGIKSKKFELIQIERAIGKNVIKFPKGLDVSMNLFPNERWRGVFDLYLCHSNIDYNLIKKKFGDVKCTKIGYPRFENSYSLKDARNLIFNEIKEIDVKKPIILWVPAHIKIKIETTENIKLWLPIVKKLQKKYNVIVRPHPKTLVTNPEVVGLLKNSGLIVDSKFDRKLSTLYLVSDLVLADYGGSVLDTIYMEKDFILLNMTKYSEFYQWRVDGGYVDQKIRDDVSSIEYKEGLDIHEQVSHAIKYKNLVEKLKLKDAYFGSMNDCTKIEGVVEYIQSLTHCSD
jgi:hypothetical protein